MKSTDFNTKDGPAAILVMTTEDEILAFIAGDERKTVIDAANKKIAELRGPKQGEQASPMTKDASDFKEGIQKTKAVDRNPVSATDTEDGHGKRTVVTCEDVLKKMRDQGKKI